MQAQPRHPYGSAVHVVARILGVLKIEGTEKSAPKMNIVERFYDIFAPVIQAAVSQQKAEPSKLQIFAMVPGKAVADE